MKVLLIAPNAGGLRDFLNRKEGVEVIDAFSDLYSNLANLMQKMTIGDRLLYLCTNETLTFTKDLSALSELLNVYGNMFKFEEIIFYIQLNTTSSDYSKYVKQIMSDFPNQKYTIPTTKMTIAYTDAYNVLLGHTDLLMNKKVTETIYVKPRGSKVKAVYSEQPSNNVIPFNYDNLAEYENLKNATAARDIGKLVTEATTNEVNIHSTEEKPYLGDCSVQHLSTYKNIIVLTGDPAAGTTMYFDYLAMSTIKAGKNAFLFNLMESEDFLKYFDVFNPELVKDSIIYEPEDLVNLTTFEYTNRLGFFTPGHLTDQNKLSLLPYVLNHPDLKSGFVFIEIPNHFLQETCNLLQYRLLQVLYITESVEEKFKSAINYIHPLRSSAVQIAIWLNNFSRARYKVDVCEFEELMKIKPKALNCIKPVYIENWSGGPELYNEIIAKGGETLG